MAIPATTASKKAPTATPRCPLSGCTKSIPTSTTSRARCFRAGRTARIMGARALLARARELDDFAGAEHARLERGAHRRAGQLVADLLDVVLGHDGDAVHRENDVAAQGHLLAADRDGPVASEQAHVPRHRTLGDRLHEKPGGRPDVEDRGEVTGEQHALERTPEHLALDQELLRRVDRHDEAKPRAPAGR